MRWLAPASAAPARLVTLRPPLADVLLAAGVLAVAQVETWTTSSFQPKPPLALLAVLITVPLAWRRRAPFGALLAMGVAASVLGTGWPRGAPSARPCGRCRSAGRRRSPPPSGAVS
jgi:hypothetical protein